MLLQRIDSPLYFGFRMYSISKVMFHLWHVAHLFMKKWLAQPP